MPKRDRSAKDLAYDKIKVKILDLELRPGQRVDDIQLSAELGLSRTPVREALFHLGSDGLIQIGARGGFTVQGLDLLDIRQLFEAHLMLAKSVARLLTSRISDEGIDQLEAASNAVDRATSEGNPASIASANTYLHMAEAKLARNMYLEFLAARIHSQGQRLAFLSFGGDGMTDPHLAEHYRTACLDHAEMIVALRSRDADRAEEIATRHVHLFRSRMTTFLAAGVLDDVTMTGIDL